MSENRPLIGIGMMATAVGVNATKDGLIKILGASYDPIFILWVQMLIISLIFMPFIVSRHGWNVILPKPLGLQFLRGVFVTLGVGGFYVAVQYIPLADTTALVFVAPLVVTALSPFVLKETVGKTRWLAIIFGFVGVLIILRPDFSGNRFGYYLALGAGCSLGLFYMINRTLAKYTPPFVAVFYMGITSSILLTPLGPFRGTIPQYEDALLILFFFVLTSIGQVLMITAFRFAPASTIAPFQYVQLLVATAFGWYVFQAFPDQWTWIGITLVIAAGLFIAYCESQPLKKAI
ncbi:MAG: DMT family transporter [SAR324 cluster bacterium]|nr:DMT family transporter [SAR324 cluster bacterium]